MAIVAGCIFIHLKFDESPTNKCHAVVSEIWLQFCNTWQSGMWSGLWLLWFHHTQQHWHLPFYVVPTAGNSLSLCNFLLPPNPHPHPQVRHCVNEGGADERPGLRWTPHWEERGESPAGYQRLRPLRQAPGGRILFCFVPPLSPRVQRIAHLATDRNLSIAPLLDVRSKNALRANQEMHLCALQVCLSAVGRISGTINLQTRAGSSFSSAARW